ncbi:MAG: hypothetical protein SF187_11800 [Deltaproteobacteria bacterium]|nr:hypothetical protein [Deltaproteobacteria bacterium]
MGPQNRRFLAVTFVVVSVLLAGEAGAEPYAGAASTRRLIAEVLKRCPGAASLAFDGTSSSKAEEALVLQQQQTSPMTRDLGPSLTCQAPSPGEAEGLLVGLDAVSLYAAPTDQALCLSGLTGGVQIDVEDQNGIAGVQCPGCNGNQYPLADWKDVLRLVYLGLPKAAGADLSQRDCNSDVRHTLVNRWVSLFGSGCIGNQCSRLEHAFRPGDHSEKTALFLSLLGLANTAPVNAFCNGVGAPAFPAVPTAKDALSDFWDGDPVRRPCDSNHQVCAADHTLGLVLPVVVPENLPPEVAYPTQPCSFGVCRFLFTNQLVLTCPNGKPQLFGKCFQQVANLPNGQFTAACVPDAGYTCFGAGNQDGRVYTKATLNPNGTYAVDGAGRALTGSFHRLNATRARGAGSPCRQTNGLAQIACLSQSVGCSMGAAGIDSGSGVANVMALPVAGVAPTIENVRKKAEGEQAPGAYPLAARVLLNSMRGFDVLTSPAEGNLTGCFNSPSLMAAALNASGLTPLATPPKCVDFDERACGLTLFNRNACNKRMFNWCPTISGLFVAPTTTGVGGSISLFASATDDDGALDPMEYVWSAPSGAFADRFAKNTKFTCTAPGTFDLQLAVWDGACKTEQSVTVTCVAPTL